MWFQALLTNKMIADGKLADLISSFHTAFMYRLCPNDMARFVGRTTYEEDRKQVITRVYFSPHCTSYFPPMALEYFATACEKPDKEELTLLVGPENAFDLIDTMYVTIGATSDTK